MVCVVVVHMYGLNPCVCVCVFTTVAIATIEHTTFSTIVIRQNNISGGRSEKDAFLVIPPHDWKRFRGEDWVK